MKKSGFFLVLFSLLASAVWGQNTYVWAGYSDTVNPDGDHNWFTPANWQVNGSTATTYPGDGNRTADIAVFNNAISGSAYINIQDEFTLGELQINANVQLAFRNWKGGANTYYDINVTNLVLNGRLTADRVGWDDGTNSNIFDPANQGVVYIQNLTSSNGEFTSTNCTIGLGNRSTPASFAQLTIAPGMITVHAGDLINGANNSITAGGITMGGALNGGGNLSLNGTVTISAALGGTTALGSLNVTGPVVLNANVTTSGVQNYNGTVQLGGARTLTGSTVTLGTITGGGNALTIAGNAVLAGGSGIGALQINGTGNTAVINGNITATTSVTINATGTATINANITTTGTGTPQRYYGPVVLGANVTFTAPANSTVRFDGTVNSDGTARSLTVATAILRFSALVGNTAPLSTVTATGAGNHRLVVGVTTTGNQTYGIVRLGNTANTSVTLAAGTGTITFNGTIGSNNTTAHALTVTSGNVVFSGAVGVNGNPISTLTVNGTGTTTIGAVVNYTTSVAINSTGTANINANVTTTGTAGQIYTGPVALGGNITFTGTANSTVRFASTVNSNNATARSLTVTTANARFDGTVGSTANPITSVSVAGTSAINANITTTGAQTYTGAVTLGANVDLTANAGSLVTFSNTVNGDTNARTLTITTANVQFNGAVGGITPPLSITVNGGTVTQGAGGSITTPSLSINSASAITLTNANNAVGALTITGTGNQAVQFTNNVNLSIAGINRPNSAVTITNGANRNISIDGAITSTSLALLADTGDVAVHSNISVSGTNETHTQNAAVYIRAASFSGTGGINLTSANGWACAEISSDVSYSGSVTPDGNGNPRIHFHAPANRHIVYRTGANIPAGYTGIAPGTYMYLRADTALGPNITYSTTGTGNVYIIDVGNISPANTRTVNFSTAAGGYIEIRGAYTSSGNLVLTPGTGGIRLDTASIDLTGTGSVFNTYTPSVPLTLLSGSNSIKTTDIIELGNVTAQNNSNLDLNATTAVRLHGTTGTAAASLGAITVTSQYLDLYGTTSIHARDAILFNLSVHTNLGGTPTLVSTNSNITLNSNFIGGGGLTMTAGGNITISGQVGGSSPIALIGNISATAAGVTFNEINAGSVTVNNSGLYTQTGPVNAGGIFDQTGSGAVSLANSITAVSSNRNNAVIRFNSMVNIMPVAGATLAVPTTGGTVHLALGASGNTLMLNGGSAGAHLTFEQGGGTLENVTVIQYSYVSLGTTGNAVSQNAGRTLTLQPEATLDTSAGSWHIGTPAVTNAFAGNNGTLNLGAGSRLICNELNLIGTPFTVSNTVSGVTEWAYISVKGNANISAAVNSGNINPQLILEMSGSGNQNITTAQALGSLHVKPGSHTHLTADLIIKGEVQIEYPGVLDADIHNIEMRAGLSGTKNGAPAKVGRWITINAPVPVLPVSQYDMNAFQQEPGSSVTFKKESTADTNVYFEIIGQTVWQKFICKEPGAVIQFSTNPDQHMFLDTFEIEGAPGGTNYSNYVTLTRLPPQDNPHWINPGWIVNPGWIFIYDGTTPPDQAKGIPIAPPPVDLKVSNERYYFWNFNLVTPAHGQRLLEIKYATIYFSHAWNQRIPIDPDTMFLWAIPYFKGPPNEGYFNYDWIRVRKIVYSFVEDSNGNGKLDRIRVQTNVNLNGVFDRFNVAVEGYRVDTSRGTNGFATVYSITNDANDQASFYIYIEEPPWLYDGSTITWWVTENRDSLKDIATQTQLIGEPGNGEYFKTTNTIPPRISYALTLPGHNQTYVRMSQPVTVTGPLTVGGNRITDPDAIAPVEGTQGHTVQLEYRFFDETVNRYPFPVPAGTLGYLLELEDSPSVFDLAFLLRVGGSSPEYFTIQGMITDLGVRALDWHDILIDADSYLYYPSPRYPIDWNYSKYANFSGNGHIAGLSPDAPTGNPTVIFLPPNRLLTVNMMERLENNLPVTPSDNYTTGNARRSTDVLVSRPPSSTDYENYFAWPVWARYTDASANPGLLNAGNSFWGQQNTDSGIIWAFDGSKFLEAHDITLQIRVNEDQLPSGFVDINLYFAPNVPAELRNPSDAGIRGRTSGGLWLPAPPENPTINPLFNIASTRPGIANGHLLFYPAERQFPISGSSPLFVFSLEKVTSGVRMDFLIRLEGTSADPYLFIARLDAPPGVVPSDWWRRVRPFSFDIQDVRMQRGGVAILNNVINSDTREVARIRYNLVRPGRVTIQVYTLDGTLVKSIRRNEYRDIGEWDDMWDGTNNGGRAVARGMYFVRVVAPDIDEIREIMVIK